MNDSKIEELLSGILQSLLRIESRLSGKTTVGNGFDQSENLTDSTLGFQPICNGGSDSDTSELRRFLASRHIGIKAVPIPDAADEAIDVIAVAIGANYKLVKNLLAKIKRCMANGRGFTEDISKLPHKEVGMITKVCASLHRLAFLEDYRYFRAPQFLITAKTSRLPRAINFFSGQWLERWLQHQIKKCHAQVKLNMCSTLGIKLLSNPQIILPNGDNFELDVLATVEGKAFFWFEAKTGDYQRYAEKYSKFARLLDLKPSNAFMILPDIGDEDGVALSALFSMKVVNLKTFELHFTESLRNVLAPAQSSDEADVGNQSGVQSIAPC